MEDSLRTQIVLAAFSAAGPADPTDFAKWQTRVADMAAVITVACQPGSTISKVIEQVSASKTFVASIVKVEKEERTTRGIVTLRTKPSELNPEGVETARTERTDNPIGLSMARRLSKLVGHKVLLRVEVEPIANGARKSRVIRYVEDFGLDPELALAAAK